jgi:hypothetical protein
MPLVGVGRFVQQPEAVYLEIGRGTRTSLLFTPVPTLCRIGEITLFKVFEEQHRGIVANAPIAGISGGESATAR